MTWANTKVKLDIQIQDHSNSSKPIVQSLTSAAFLEASIIKLWIIKITLLEIFIIMQTINILKSYA